MNNWFVLIPIMMLSGLARADSSVTVPWLEFESLYRKHIEEQLKRELESKLSAPVYVLDEAAYQLRVSETTAVGTVRIRGRVLQGAPVPIPIFAKDIAVTEVKQIAGAHLLADDEGYRLYARESGEFEVTLGLSAPLRSEGPRLRLSFVLPAAVLNVVSLDTARSMALVDTGGVKQTDGSYYFSPLQTLSMNFERSLVPAQEKEVVRIDSFSELSLRGERLKVKSYFVPLHAVNGAVKIQLSRSAMALATSLPSGSITPMDGGVMEVDFPDGWRDPFEIQYEIVVAADVVDVSLPKLIGNSAREGEFRIEQTAAARVVVNNTGVKTGLPAHGIDDAMRSYAGLDEPYSRLARDKDLQLAIDRFQAVGTPEVVLDSLYFYASYAEDGSILKAVRLTMPPGAGRRLVLQAIPGAEIWSLKVNGKVASLYTQAARHWVIPLVADAESEIELAFLQRGPKLGLEGRLELAFPGTGLTARRVNVAIGLSERVDLVAMDGDLQPAQPKGWPELKGFSGRPHFFTRPYYRGQGIDTAIYYREPVIKENNR